MCQFDEKVLKNDAEKSGLFEIVEGWYAAVSVWKSFRIVEGKRSRDLWSVFTKVFAIERRGQCDQNCDRWRPRESRDFVFVNWSMLPAISRKIVKIWAERKSQRFHEIFADPLRSITFLKKFVCACEVKIWAVEPSFSRKFCPERPPRSAPCRRRASVKIWAVEPAFSRKISNLQKIWSVQEKARVPKFKIEAFESCSRPEWVPNQRLYQLPIRFHVKYFKQRQERR